MVYRCGRKRGWDSCVAKAVEPSGRGVDERGGSETFEPRQDRSGPIMAENEGAGYAH